MLNKREENTLKSNQGNTFLRNKIRGQRQQQQKHNKPKTSLQLKTMENEQLSPLNKLEHRRGLQIEIASSAFLETITELSLNNKFTSETLE